MGRRVRPLLVAASRDARAVAGGALPLPAFVLAVALTSYCRREGVADRAIGSSLHSGTWSAGATRADAAASWFSSPPGGWPRHPRRLATAVFSDVPPGRLVRPVGFRRAPSVVGFWESCCARSSRSQRPGFGSRRDRAGHHDCADIARSGRLRSEAMASARRRMPWAQRSGRPSTRSSFGGQTAPFRDFLGMGWATGETMAVRWSSATRRSSEGHLCTDLHDDHAIVWTCLRGRIQHRAVRNGGDAVPVLHAARRNRRILPDRG
jgi:hypothetical protein